MWAMEDELWRAYDEMGPAWAEHAEDGLYNAHYDRPCVLELCGDVAGRRVVDACCGAGFYMAELIARGATVVGFDASATMVALARARVGEAAEVIEARLGDPLPVADESVDLVVCALAIHYVEDKGPALAELHRILRPGGVLVISTQHPTTDWLRKGGSYFDVAREVDRWRDVGTDVAFWREPLTVLCEAIHRAGFLIERLVEPQVDTSLRARWGSDIDFLLTNPGFLALRLLRP